MPSERLFPMRMPESVLRSLDAAIGQGLPAREAALVAGLLNALIDAGQVPPCASCAHLVVQTCSSPALERIPALTSETAPGAATNAAHCTLHEPRS